MFVKEVIDGAKELLNEFKLNCDVGSLLTCYNIIEKEIAFDHFNLHSIDLFTLCDDSTIKYDDFSKSPFKILNVFDGERKTIKFRECLEYIKIDGNSNKEVTVVYCYAPLNKGIDDLSEYTDIYKRLLILGVLSEYFLVNGMYKRAEEYNKLFVDEISIINNNENK